MAKLKSMPEKDIISGFKGIIDFYVYRHSADPEVGMPGVPCARKWPRSPGHKRAPAVEAQWPAFTTASRLWTQLSPQVQETYNAMSHGSSLSGRDIFAKGYLRGNYPYPKEVGMLPCSYAYLSANLLNLVHNDPTIVPFDTELYDIGGNFDTVNHRFVCPRDGRYLVLSTITWFNLIPDKQYHAYCRHNGVNWAPSTITPAINIYYTQQIQSIFNCVAGDTLDILVISLADADTVDIYGNNDPAWTRFVVALIE